MTPMSGSGELTDVLRAPSSTARGAAPRRLSLRATGLLAILGVMMLAMLLVVSALLFRGAVQSNLEALEQANTRSGNLLQQRLDEAAGKGDAARLHELDRQLGESEADRAQRLAHARNYMDGSTVTLAVLAWLGITCIGALAMLFFSRLPSTSAPCAHVRWPSWWATGGKAGRWDATMN
jgi:hypothetical protein